MDINVDIQEFLEQTSIQLKNYLYFNLKSQLDKLNSFGTYMALRNFIKDFEKMLTEEQLLEFEHLKKIGFGYLNDYIEEVIEYVITAYQKILNPRKKEIRKRYDK